MDTMRGGFIDCMVKVYQQDNNGNFVGMVVSMIRSDGDGPQIDLVGRGRFPGRNRLQDPPGGTAQPGRDCHMCGYPFIFYRADRYGWFIEYRQDNASGDPQNPSDHAVPGDTDHYRNPVPFAVQ